MKKYKYFYLKDEKEEAGVKSMHLEKLRPAVQELAIMAKESQNHWLNMTLTFNGIIKNKNKHKTKKMNKGYKSNNDKSSDHSSDSSTSTDFAIYPLVNPIHEFNMSTIPENAQVVGTVALRLNPSSNKTIVELSHMSVDEIYRNHGVGSRLLDTALSCIHSHASSSNAIASIELSVMTELVAAIRLYKTKNFIPVGSVEACGTCSLQRMILPLNLK